jgi:hypothetical protein
MENTPLDARTTLRLLRMESRELLDWVRKVNAEMVARSDVREYVSTKAEIYEEDGEVLYFSRAYDHPELI